MEDLEVDEDAAPATVGAPPGACDEGSTSFAMWPPAAGYTRMVKAVEAEAAEEEGWAEPAEAAAAASWRAA